VLGGRRALGHPLRGAARVAALSRLSLTRLAAPLAATALSLAACGAAAEPVPQGPPAQRHGARAVADVERVERARASLVAAINLYEGRRGAEAVRHLDDARSTYAPLRPRVRARDAVLDREVEAASTRARAAMVRGDPPRPGLARLRALNGQLTDGVLAALVPRAAREDAGLRAEVARRLARELAAAYAAGVAARGPARRRGQLQRAYGLLARAGVTARGLGGALGPARPDVLEPLRGIRDRVWPVGIERPPAPPPAPARVSRAVRRAGDALTARFALDG
jgi:hypothetical protein